MENDKNVIGKVIKKYRNYNGLSRTQLAEKLNVSDRLIEKYEYGKSKPPYLMIKKLHKVLDIPILEIFDLKEDTEGYVTKVVERLLKYGALEVFEKNPELIDVIKFYSKNAKSLKDVNLLKLLNKISRLKPAKKETTIENINKLLG